MTNWERHQERISKAKFALEFTGMITDLYGDFQNYCYKYRNEYNNKCEQTPIKCRKCYLDWLDMEVEE